MVGEHHQLNGQKSEQTQGDREGQGSLGMLRSMGSQSRTRLNEVIDTNLKSRKTLETYIYIYMMVNIQSLKFTALSIYNS